MLIGIDTSERMVAYARAEAKTLQIDMHVNFYARDALRMLEFPNHYFDLVKQHSGNSYLRTRDCRQLLHEYQRVTVPMV